MTNENVSLTELWTALDLYAAAVYWHHVGAGDLRAHMLDRAVAVGVTDEQIADARSYVRRGNRPLMAGRSFSEFMRDYGPVLGRVDQNTPPDRAV
ncbi:hypothetical protein [Mycobacteroides abscessus]|uniref:hypothetical protein n=1 Tax=Mycobacteroides abscessus TaxID=36809 RepID=UPI000928B854|nr:hypothetical protein [Mycobacteroides abscessus]SHX65800.1 Uncharacterised protein [Mycobacteroides abscessus subsp. abscessus]SHZ17156.1 Uncharacterised protein [Mycobacteroides abscessus subsp. abscessus]SIB51774.1 Uncharacterised protein [Mycobacteroides abscessus subsp. abscessus]SIF17330.1 Uncharacterised protein [Mycobacteroides abscessus subsp. abscessus]SKI47813.1 Uncharacterised protein [Mycobacteroides abscessus subsp. abscessus]